MVEVPRAPVDSREAGSKRGGKGVRGKSVLTTSTPCAWIDERWSEATRIGEEAAAADGEEEDAGDAVWTSRGTVVVVGDVDDVGKEDGHGE